MSSHIYRKAHRGQPFQFPAQLYNKLVETTLREQDRRTNQQVNPVPFDTRGAVVWVRNGAEPTDPDPDLELGSPVAITGLVIDAGEQASAQEFVFEVGVPAAGDRGRWGVLLDPLAAQGVGRMALAGPVLTRVEIPSGCSTLCFADVQAGEAGHLQVVGAGAGRILWLEEETAGVQRALVHIGTHPAVFPVELDQVGGTAGNATTVCTFTYDILDPVTGETLASAVDIAAAPHNQQRPVGFLEEATLGLASWNQAGVPVLSWTNEEPAQEVC